MRPLALVAVSLPTAVALQLRAGRQPVTFRGFYDGHASGRGLWKWENALDAYQQLLGSAAGHPVDVAEVGVQSGGSLLMWQAVLGAQCHVYGLDINPKCMAFQDNRTTIALGDQGNPNVWNHFFAHTCHSLDILVDDGGHEPHQMLTTLNSVFPRLNAGGVISIEDIHGLEYIQSFFTPAAALIAEQHLKGAVASVHVYPFVLAVRRSGQSTRFPHAEPAPTAPTVVVDSFEGLWATVPSVAGGTVTLRNPTWGSLLTRQALSTFFAHFGELHASHWTDAPVGCERTASPVCTVTVVNGEMQSLITGVHVYADHVDVQVAVAPPAIRAVRRGTEWITYG